MSNHNNLQVGKSLAAIRENYRKRYEFAAAEIRIRYPNIAAGDWILDMGCGTGYGSLVLHALTGAGVISVDTDAEALQHGATYFPIPEDKVERVCGDLTDGLDKLVGSRGLVAAVAFEMIEHVADAPALLRDVRKHAPLFLGSVPNQLVVPYDAKRHRWRDTRHFRHYTPNEIRDDLTGAGWHLCYLGGQTGKAGEGAHIKFAPAHVKQSRTLVFVAEETR